MTKSSTATSVWPSIASLALLIILIATALPILGVDGDTFRYLYTAGAALALVARLLTPRLPKSAPIRARRLQRIEVWTAIIFCAGAFFVWYYKHTAPNDWVAFTLAGGILQLYTSIALPRALSKK